MNLDSLITVTSLIVAVYAILPRVRQLELSIRFGKIGWLILSVALMLILYLQFYQTFRALNLTPGLNLSRWSITPSNASFIVLVATTLSMCAYIRVKRLSRSNVVKFREYVCELSREKRYSELFSLIEGNLDQLTRIYNGSWSLKRLQDRLVNCSRERPLYNSRLSEVTSSPRKNKLNLIVRLKKPWKKSCFLLSRIFPNFDNEKEVAKEIIHEILVNRSTVKAIAETRPYFALNMFSAGFSEEYEFIDIYLRYLANDTQSILYHEIRNNQNLEHRDRYALPERNQLLNKFFADCRVAEKYGVYQPIGEFVIAHLDEIYSRKEPDLYNEPMGNFYDQGQWDSKLLVGIRFFDVMVTSALYQDIYWHMWLYYFPHFVERILRNLKPNEKLVDPDEEWPTKYHYAIYLIISCLCKWVTAVDHIPLNQKNVILESVSANHENGNIPKSSMLAIGQINKLVLSSDEVSDKFKRYITDIIFRSYFDLRKNNNTKLYAEALINSLQHGGFSMGTKSIDYAQKLLDAFDEFDKVPFDLDLSNELREELKCNVDSASKE